MFYLQILKEKKNFLMFLISKSKMKEARDHLFIMNIKLLKKNMVGLWQDKKNLKMFSSHQKHQE